MDDELFGRFMGHFRDTLAELGAANADIEEDMGIAYGGKDDVMGR